MPNFKTAVQTWSCLLQVHDGTQQTFYQEPATVEKCKELSKQLFYTRLASIPKRNESFWKEVAYVKNSLKNRKEFKVEKIGVAALFGLECFAWLWIGEIVGRGFTVTGYHV